MFEPTSSWPSYIFGQLCMCIGTNIMTRYDFLEFYLEARQIILSNVRKDSNLT